MVVYHNQRYSPGHGFKDNHLLPTDRWRYSNEDGKASYDTLHEASFALVLQNPAYFWEEDSVWELDTTRGGDSEYWSYATDFGNDEDCYVDQPSSYVFVRRRRYTRLMMCVSDIKQRISLGIAQTKTMEIYENERYLPGNGFSSKGLLLPFDRCCFSSKDGSCSWTSLDDVNMYFQSVCPGFVWDEQSQWQLTESSWKYAVDFTADDELFVYSETLQNHHFVRRRKYTRHMIFSSQVFDNWIAAFDAWIKYRRKTCCEQLGDLWDCERMLSVVFC